MKRDKKFTLSLLVVIALCVLVGCGNGDQDSETSQVADFDDVANGQDYEGMGNVAEMEEGYDGGSVDTSGLETTGTKTEEASASFDRKIIKNASLEMEASDSIGLYKELAKYGNELGGYEFSYDISNYETYSIIHAIYKIPPEQLDSFINLAGETGKIINNSMSSEDVTDSYYDTETRLESKRKSLEQYYALLQKATTIEEITKIQNIIDQITEEMEASEGKLKMWNSLVEMATVELHIRQENDPVKIKKEIHWNTLSVDDMGYLVRRGLVSLLNTLISLLQWIMIAIVVTSPLWIIAVIAVWIWFKKRKAKKTKEDTFESSNGGNGSTRD